MPWKGPLLTVLVVTVALEVTLASAAQAASPIPVLRPGDRGGEVAIWQTALNIARSEIGGIAARRHSRPLVVDGVFGPLTERATRRFQRAFRVRVSGVVGYRSWAAFYPGQMTASCVYSGGLTPPPLAEGDWSPCVGWWQLTLNRWLRRHDRKMPQLIPDGVFGPLTLAGTLIFQRAHGLRADGLVGPRTWGAAA